MLDFILLNYANHFLLERLLPETKKVDIYIVYVCQKKSYKDTT